MALINNAQHNGQEHQKCILSETQMPIFFINLKKKQKHQKQEFRKKTVNIIDFKQNKNMKGKRLKH